MIEHSLCVAGSLVSSGLIPGVMWGHWWRIVGFLPCSCIQLWGHSIDPMLIPDKECFIYLRNNLALHYRWDLWYTGKLCKRDWVTVIVVWKLNLVVIIFRIFRISGISVKHKIPKKCAFARNWRRHPRVRKPRRRWRCMLGAPQLEMGHFAGLYCWAKIPVDDECCNCYRSYCK